MHSKLLYTHTHMQMPPCGFFTLTVKLKFWQADKIFYSTIAVFIYLYEPKACTERTILKLTHTHKQFFSVMLIEFAQIQSYIAIHIFIYTYICVHIFRIFISAHPFYVSRFASFSSGFVFSPAPAH